MNGGKGGRDRSKRSKGDRRDQSRNIGSEGCDDDANDAKKDGGDRFADLIGETKPIRGGPPRVAPAASKPKRKRETSDAKGRAAFRWPHPDEPLRAGAAGVSDSVLLALSRGEPEPEERIDLHGVRREAAARLVRDRIASARARGLRCVCVIHGRGRGSESGEAVLRDALPGWLSAGACAKHVLGFAPAPQRLGGIGATIVLLRRDG
jgi:DNA-nicking Smr family endonuclease